MSVQAENRYKAFAARQAAAQFGSLNDAFVRDLNALPKKPGARAPFADIHFIASRGGWWAECPTTGFGYFYPSLREAVSSWLVAVFLDRGILVGQPI